VLARRRSERHGPHVDHPGRGQLPQVHVTESSTSPSRGTSNSALGAKSDTIERSGDGTPHRLEGAVL
jgi:hypothetical protein